MRRLLGFASGLVTCVVILAGAGSAAAHPLGNFTINHLSRVAISSRAIDVHYILDQAEIPTFQERDLTDAEVLEHKRKAIVGGLVLVVDGRRTALEPTSPGRLSKPPGQGGLPLTRVELGLRAPVDGAHRVELRDETFPGRIGLFFIIVRAGR